MKNSLIFMKPCSEEFNDFKEFYRFEFATNQAPYTNKQLRQKRKKRKHSNTFKRKMKGNEATHKIKDTRKKRGFPVPILNVPNGEQCKQLL